MLKVVLIVDDSRVMRQLVRRSLRQAGYKAKEVVEAESGVDAMRLLREGLHPNLILSDWNMPGMTGIELLQTMKEERFDFPLGFVTSESTPDMRAIAMSEGARFLLTKPFASADVRHAMESAGYKPKGELRNKTRVEISSQTFGSELITTLLDHLVNQRITARPGAPFPTDLTPAISCTWVDDEDVIRYVGLCDMPLSAALGAAISLRPSAFVKEILDSETIPEDLRPDCREVFNVLSRGFTNAGSVHVRLLDITYTPDPPLASVLELNAEAPGRKDFKVSVGDFGAGRIAFVSTSPGFIHFAD